MASLAHEGVIFLGDSGHAVVYQNYHLSLTVATDTVGLKLSALDGYRRRPSIFLHEQNLNFNIVSYYQIMY